MADEYYPTEGEDTDVAPSQNAPEDTETEPVAEETESEGATALIPKSVLKGKDFKPGDSITVKITHVYEDEIAVEEVSKSPETKPETEMPTPANDELDAMAAMKGK